MNGFLKKKSIQIFLIILLTFLIYIPALKSGFIWDDDIFLTKNPLIKAGDGLWRFWFTSEPTDYFPMTSTSLWIEWRLWGENPAGYHAVNIVIHILNSILLWALLSKLGIQGAWLAGVLFAVHPVNVESVAWITERKNLLPLFFSLISIGLYLKFETEKRISLYLSSTLSFMLALLSKASVVMHPFVLLLCIWWRKRTLTFSDLKRAAPFFVLSLIFGLVTVWFQYHNAIGDHVIRTDSFLSRLAIAGKAVWFYLYKALLPFKLSFVYPRWETGSTSLNSFSPLLLLTITVGLFYRYRRGWSRPFLFGITYYVLTLLPVLGFFNIYFMRYSLVADHWQYLSIPGIIALFSGTVTNYYEKNGAIVKKITLSLIVLIMITLSFQTWKQSQIYKNSKILWKDTISKYPKVWLAHNNLGNILRREGRHEEALQHFKKAVKENADYPEAYKNMGNTLTALGKPDEAVRAYIKAITLDPQDADIHKNIASLYFETGRLNKAEHHYKEALKIKPDNVESLINLGVALAKQKRYKEAIHYYKKALHKKSNSSIVHNNIGSALRRIGLWEEALDHLKNSISIDPEYPNPYKNIAILFVKKGEINKGIEYLSEYLKLRPEDKETREKLNILLEHKDVSE